MSVTELAAKFRVTLEGGTELSAWLDAANTKTKQLERNATSAFSVLSKGAKDTAVEMAKFAASAGKTALATSGLSLGISAQAKSILEFRDQVNRLGTAASLAENQIGGLKSQILDVAVASGQMKDTVTDALAAFVAKTGDIETARRNLELYAKTATGTGAALSEVSLIGAELSSKMGIVDQRRALGILAKQGDVGAIEFKDLAIQGPRIFAAAAGAGLKGEAGVRAIGGLAQLFAEGVGGSGSAARVATSIEGLFRDVSKKIGRQRIEELGITVGDRDAVEIVKDVIRKFNGNDRAIQNAGIFTAASFRGVQTLSRTFRESGSFAELDKFINAAGDVGTIDEKFARNMKSGKSALNVAQAKIDRSYDRNLGDSIEKLARSADKLASVVDFATAHPGAVVGGGVAAMLARNLWRNRGGNVVSDMVGGSGQRVFVTNWPNSLGGPGGAPSFAPKALGALAASPLGVLAATAALVGIPVGVAAYQSYKTDETINAANANVDPVAAQRFGTGYARDRKAKFRHEVKLFGEGEAPSLDAAMQDAQKNAVVDLDYDKFAEAFRNLSLTFNLNPDGSVDTEGTRAPEVKVRRGWR